MPALITPTQAAAAIAARLGARRLRDPLPQALHALAQAAAPAAATGSTSPACAASPGCSNAMTPRRPARRGSASSTLLRSACTPHDVAAAGRASTPPTRASRTRSTRCRACRAIQQHLRAHVRGAGRAALRRDAAASCDGDAVFPDLGLPLPLQALRHATRADASAAARTCAGDRRPHQRCTATTGTRPKSCTKSCRCVGALMRWLKQRANS